MSEEKPSDEPMAAAPTADAPETSAPFAWQPLTPKGAAAFAVAPLGRLLLALLVMAIVVAATVVWLLRLDYAPAIAQAARLMPDTARFQEGRLRGISETALAQTKFLAVAVTPDDTVEIGQSADAQIQFRPKDLRIDSVFKPNWGLDFPYQNWNYDLSRAALEPLWEAWRPVVLTLCGVATGVAWGAVWLALATVYALPVWLAAWLADRRISLAAAWKLSGASLTSGAALLALALFLYGIRAVDLIGLACFFLGHFVLPWIVIGCSIRHLPAASSLPPKNPFSQAG